LSADASGNGKAEGCIISRGDEAAIIADVDRAKKSISRISEKDVLLIQEATKRLEYPCYGYFLVVYLN